MSISWIPTVKLRRNTTPLVSESEFDEIFGRIQQKGLSYWADPAQTQPGEINHNDGGRGMYFEDLNGLFLEIITRPYGSGN